MSFARMMNHIHGQPESYEKKSKYKVGRTLGSGTYGVVKEAEGPTGKVAVKIILKKNVKNNEQMVYDELNLLQRLQHPHIVKFVDWFESRDKFYIVTELATGGELFDRICEQGKFTEKDASQTIKQVLDAVSYLHQNNVVHRDLKPENLLYVTPDAESDLVLADFGIAKSLDTPKFDATKKGDDGLNTMAGSFGYAAPEVMDGKGHGKPVDLWSLGVITYTLLCGYSPFRSENLQDLLGECKSGNIIFHERYWRDVSQDARDFINGLLVPDPEDRWNCEQAMKHIWLSGQNATDHDLIPELKQRKLARAALRRAINKKILEGQLKGPKKPETDPKTNDTGEAQGAEGEQSELSTTVEKSAAAMREHIKDGSGLYHVVRALVMDSKVQKELEAEPTEAELTEARLRASSSQNSR